MASRKAIVLGVDGGTWTALEPYMGEGTMPNLKRIMAKSAHGKLRSVIPPITGPAWSSFATGVNPGRHGYYFFFTMRSFGDLRPACSNDIQVETFYETLVRNGRKCTVINLPVSYPARIERTMITSLLSTGYDIVHPPELAEEIPLLKDYEIIPTGLRSPESRREFGIDKDLIIENESVRFEVAKELFERDWDFFFLLFSGSDWISHRAFIEMLSGEGPKARGAREYFRKLDEWLGWFYDNSDEGTLKIICSDHGFRVRKGNLSINSWLEQNGFLSYRPKAVAGETVRDLEMETLKPSVARVRDAVSKNRLTAWALPYLKKVFERPGRFRKMVAKDVEVDFANSKAFGTGEGIFIREGLKDELRVIDELEKGLLRLNDRYGIFKSVEHRDNVYWGQCVEMMPDLLLVDCDFINNRIRRKNPFIEEPVPGHDKDGIWVLSGPADAAGRQANASLMDIGPTVLDWMEVEPAVEPDGTSLLSKLELK